MPFQSQPKESLLRQPHSAAPPATEANLRTAKEHELARTTAFPNALLDQVMPKLKDTEWRLLCIVVRQTLGWQSHGRRKRRDWLTQRQLTAKSGRNSQAVSRAIDTLVRQGLLEVQDQVGNVLVTPAERRRHGGRLYYRLGMRLSGTGARDGARGDAVDVTTDQAATKITQGSVKSPVGKSHTTKTTGTKYLSYDKEPESPGSPFSSKISSPGTACQEARNSDVKRFISTYSRLFRQHTASGDLPTIAWGKDGKLVKDLLKLYSYDRLEQLLTLFFERGNEWRKQRGYSLSAFKEAINSLLVAEEQDTYTHQSPQPTLRTGMWSKASAIRSPGSRNFKPSSLSCP